MGGFENQGSKGPGAGKDVDEVASHIADDLALIYKNPGADPQTRQRLLNDANSWAQSWIEGTNHMGRSLQEEIIGLFHTVDTHLVKWTDPNNRNNPYARPEMIPLLVEPIAYNNINNVVVGEGKGGGQPFAYQITDNTRADGPYNRLTYTMQLDSRARPDPDALAHLLANANKPLIAPFVTWGGRNYYQERAKPGYPNQGYQTGQPPRKSVYEP